MALIAPLQPDRSKEMEEEERGTATVFAVPLSLSQQRRGAGSRKVLLQGRTYNEHVGLRGLKRYGEKSGGLNVRIAKVQRWDQKKTLRSPSSGSAIATSKSIPGS